MNPADAYVTMREILELIYNSGYKGKVTIDNDCCYAGNLCFEAKEVWEEK